MIQRIEANNMADFTVNDAIAFLFLIGFPLTNTGLIFPKTEKNDWKNQDEKAEFLPAETVFPYKKAELFEPER